MKKKTKRRKIDIEEKIVFLTNTLGMWVVASVFYNLDNIFGMLLAFYFVINFFCFIALIGKYYKD